MQLLLRALESGEIQPVGSARTRRVDVRVIAATDADLAGAVDGGRFRAPLLHRLSGWEIRLPALAELRADVGRLLVHFLEQELRELGEESFSPSTENDFAKGGRSATNGRKASFRVSKTRRTAEIRLSGCLKHDEWQRFVSQDV